MKDLNAKRFAAKPLRQPLYNFRDVPHCKKNLEGSTISLVENRDHFLDGMAEMVLLCKEAVRRNSRTAGTKCSKPLSLEYMADRLDVDDPLWGYVIRNEEQLQGFITVTTFTNWQKTFRWDSMHDSAVAYDDEELAQQMAQHERVYDCEGNLAEALQATVRCGDPWNEGIVWPRIAEISLLGGLGCGRTLVSLVIEKLERMNSNGTRNYDYVVLQATDNSIPFYESLGFVRVGCITEDLDFGKTDKEEEKKEEEEPPPSEVVSSAVFTYVTENPGETLNEIAKKYQCDVWDIIFLNQYIYKDICPRSRLMKGTQLFVPSQEEVLRDATSHACRSMGKETSTPQWFIAKENDTPRTISKKFKVDTKELVVGNRERLPELQASSRLKEGTRIKVSHFHIKDDMHVPYCHWTFPDDTLETCGDQPSYMMALKLNRKKGAQAKVKPVESSLAVPIKTKYFPPKQAAVASQPAPTAAAKKSTVSTETPAAAEPVRPKRPPSSYMLYCSEQRKNLPPHLMGKPVSQLMKLLSEQWQELDDSEKQHYEAQYEKERALYQKAKLKYQQELKQYRKAHPNSEEKKESGLFNKVVKLVNQKEPSEFQYYYVLTYIPDLQWCHLAPLQQVGHFGADKPRAEGRPIWMLVDESQGKELDISATFCQSVSSRSMKRTADADQEQWDILESGCGNGGSCQKQEVPILARLPPPVVAAAAAPQKRGPSRPRMDGAAPVKRGPGGRLPKMAINAEASVKRGPARPSKAAMNAVKQGPERSPKGTMDTATAPVKRVPGPSPKSGIDGTIPVNRGPESPPMINGVKEDLNGGQSILVKRGRPPKKRGRPPKTKAVTTHAAAEVDVQLPSEKKRGPPQDRSSPASKRRRISEATVVSTPVKGDSRQAVESVEIEIPKGPFAVGTIVEVQSRTWPGINKPGGVARVTKVQNLENGNALYDVSYVLGGKEKNVDAGFVAARVEGSGANDTTESGFTRSSPRGKRSSNFRYTPPEDSTPKRDKRKKRSRDAVSNKPANIYAEPDEDSVATATAAAETIPTAIVSNTKSDILGSPERKRTRRSVEVIAAEKPSNEAERGKPVRKAAPTSRTSPRLIAKETSVLSKLGKNESMTTENDYEARAIREVSPSLSPKPLVKKSKTMKLAPIFTVRRKTRSSPEVDKKEVQNKSNDMNMRGSLVRQSAPLFGSSPSKSMSEPTPLLLGARRGARATTRAAA